MNRKLLLAVPVVAGVAGASWAGTTLYSGNESRAAYERVLGDLNDSVGLSLVNASYAPGFFRSEAITDIKLSDAADAEVIAQLRHVIEHSPVDTNAEFSAARVTTTFVTDEWRDGEYAEVLALFNGAEPLQLLSHVGFGGTVVNELTLAPIGYLHSNGAEVSSEAAVWNFNVAADGSFSGSGNWGGATISGKGPTITVAASSDSFNYERIAPAVYVGQYDLLVSEVGVSDPRMGLSMGVSGVSANVSNDVQQDLMSGQYSVAIADIDAPIALDSASIKAIFGGLDISSVEDIRNVETQALFTDADDEDAFMEMVREYVSVYTKIFKPGAYLGYQLALGNAGGNAEASVRATFDGDGSPSGHDLLTSPNATVGDLLAAMRVDMSVDAAGDALMMTPAAMFIDPAMLAPWVMVEPDGSLLGKVSIDDMVIDANGQAMPLDAMLGEKLQQPLELHKLLAL